MSMMKEVTNSPQKTFLTNESLTQEQEGEYIQAFILFDRDEDGLINPKELSLLIRSLECNPTDQEIQQLVDQIVEEGSNLIDRNQFLIMMGILKNTRDTDDRKELREIFNAIDTDNNGFIENEELRVAMRLLTTPSDEMKLTKEEIDEMIAEIDGDKDGRLTFEGFASIFTGQT